MPISEYSSDSIKSLSWQEQARTRPGMWIGSLGTSGVLHLINEAIDNAIDEISSGFGSSIQIHIKDIPNSLQSISVRDFGRGIPVGLNSKGVNTLTSAATVMFTGGKYDSSNYKFSGGMNGSGLKLINVFSTSLQVTSFREGFAHSQSFSLGHPTADISKSSSDEQGTLVTFTPDPSIFRDYHVSADDLKFRCECIASLLPDVKILATYNGKEIFNATEHSPLSSLIDSISLDKSVLFSIDHFTPLKDFQSTPYKLGLRLRYYPTNNKSSLSFCNNIYTPDFGSHDDALLKTLKDSFKKLTGYSLNNSQVSTGLSYVLSVQKPEPLFRGQSKTKVQDDVISQLTYQELYPVIYEALSNNQSFLKYFKSIIVSQNKLIEETALKETTHSIKESVKNNELPKSLKIAFGYKPQQRELLICEGRSASGSLKEAALPYQEVLPLRGKVLNTAKADYTKILKNKEIGDIFKAIGGMENTNTQLRTYNVFILVDSDVDGCLRNNTLIPLLEGNNVPISELVGKEPFWVWSCTPEGKLMPGQAHSARITRYVDHLYRITLDNGEFLEVTDNHPFMLQDGSYLRADNLEVGMNLMPFMSMVEVRVASIEIIQVDNEPVYDITVEKYHNFATDAGVFVHNSHIYCCIVTMFAKLFPSFIKNYNLYLCHPPLFTATDGVNYAYANTAKSAAANFKKKFGDKKFRISRNKGLGEMSPAELRPVIDPATRILTKINFTDLTEQKIEQLMGNSSESRKQLLEGIEGYDVTSDEIQFEFE